MPTRKKTYQHCQLKVSQRKSDQLVTLQRGISYYKLSMKIHPPVHFKREKKSFTRQSGQPRIIEHLRLEFESQEAKQREGGKKF